VRTTPKAQTAIYACSGRWTAGAEFATHFSSLPEGGRKAAGAHIILRSLPSLHASIVPERARRCSGSLTLALRTPDSARMLWYIDCLARPPTLPSLRFAR